MSADTLQSGPLSGKVALVTGGTRGIGLGIAERLLRDGATLWLSGRSAGTVAETVQALTAVHGSHRVGGCAGSVSHREDVQRQVDECLARFGKLDIAVANAGIERGAHFLEIEEDDWDEVIATNLKGAFLTTQIAAREMVSAGGRIVVISSTNAFFMESHIAAYNASKAGCVALMRTAALELAPLGITVNAVGPGLVHTDMTEALVRDSEHGPRYLEGIPVRRFGTPEDIAAAVAYLVSDDAGWVTGHHLVVDGGQTIGVDLPLETTNRDA
jgi:NAD(P)-dependent dehydrogenase (short-subunit alcohol dehydrogenase family)